MQQSEFSKQQPPSPSADIQTPRAEREVLPEFGSEAAGIGSLSPPPLDVRLNLLETSLLRRMAEHHVRARFLHQDGLHATEGTIVLANENSVWLADHQTFKRADDARPYDIPATPPGFEAFLGHTCRYELARFSRVTLVNADSFHQTLIRDDLQSEERLRGFGMPERSDTRLDPHESVPEGVLVRLDSSLDEAVTYGIVKRQTENALLLSEGRTYRFSAEGKAELADRWFGAVGNGPREVFRSNIRSVRPLL